MGAIIKRGTPSKPRFYLQYVDADGVRRMKRAKGCTRREQARAMLSAVELRIANGRVGIEEPPPPDPDAERRKTITVAELADAFTDDETGFTSPKIKNPADYRMEAKSVFTVRIVPTLGARPAASVTSLDVENLRDKLSSDYAAQTVTNTINTFSKLYGWGNKKKLIDCVNPCTGVERHASQDLEPITPDKYLAKLEAAQLLAVAEEHANVFCTAEEARVRYPMAAFCVYALARKGEAFGARWPDVDFVRMQITIARSYTLKPKSGKVRHVPLHPALAVILRKWKEICPPTPEGLIFPIEGRMGRPEETLGLGELMKLAFNREPPKVWHSLRHTGSAHFMMSGGNILTLQKLLGHGDLSTTLIYAHLSPQFMFDEVARLNFAVQIAGVTSITTGGHG